MVTVEAIARAVAVLRDADVEPVTVMVTAEVRERILSEVRESGLLTEACAHGDGMMVAGVRIDVPRGTSGLGA